MKNIALQLQFMGRMVLAAVYMVVGVTFSFMAWGWQWAYGHRCPDGPAGWSPGSDVGCAWCDVETFKERELDDG